MTLYGISAATLEPEQIGKIQNRLAMLGPEWTDQDLTTLDAICEAARAWVKVGKPVLVCEHCGRESMRKEEYDDLSPD